MKAQVKQQQQQQQQQQQCQQQCLLHQEGKLGLGPVQYVQSKCSTLRSRLFDPLHMSGHRATGMLHVIAPKRFTCRVDFTHPILVHHARRFLLTGVRLRTIVSAAPLPRLNTLQSLHGEPKRWSRLPFQSPRAHSKLSNWTCMYSVNCLYNNIAF